jgi:hypothetical protein
MLNTRIKKLTKLFVAFISFDAFIILILGTGTIYASPAICTWTAYGGSINWSDTNNWSCTSGTVPEDGDSLVFNQDILSASVSINNDISNLQLSNISFTGSGVADDTYTMSGNSITLSGGITDTSSRGGNDVGVPISLVSNQSFTTNHTDFLGNISLGSNNLTLSGNSGFTLLGQISGTGSLNVDSTDTTMIEANNTSFSGPVNINDGRTIVNVSNTDPLGTGVVTVANDATLQISINSAGTYTVSNPITLGGIGDGSSGQIDVENFGAGTDNVNLTGNVTLTANTDVSLSSANLDVAGNVSGCNYLINKTSGSVGTLSGILTGSCPTTNPSATSTSNSAQAPNTGYGSPHNDSLDLTISILGAISLVCGIRLLYKYKSVNE